MLEPQVELRDKFGGGKRRFRAIKTNRASSGQRTKLSKLARSEVRGEALLDDYMPVTFTVSVLYKSSFCSRISK